MSDNSPGHTHDHESEDSHAHAHAQITADTDSRRLAIALALILSYMAVEVVVGLFAHSLALIADAAHMLTDAGALGLSIWVLRLVARPAAGDLTFGLRRAEVLSAQANGFTLLVLSFLVAYGGIEHLFSPPATHGKPMLAVALAGIGVNLLATWQLAQANRQSLNIEGSFQHILTDLIAFILTAAAAAVILATGFTRADGIAALVIAAIMFRSSLALLRASGRIILEAAPKGTSVAEVGREIASVHGVMSVHDLHVWTIGSGFPALSAHVLVAEDEDCHQIRAEIAKLLEHSFAISHSTLQVEHSHSQQLLQIEPQQKR